MTPLGIRYNNPCNIRYNSANKWKGQTGQYNGFCKFKSVDYGLRACLYLLRKYRYIYGLDSVRKIISRFAPSSENDTESYISFVVNSLRDYGFHSVTADSPLDFDFYSYRVTNPLPFFLKAICHVETGYQLTTQEFITALHSLNDVH